MASTGKPASPDSRSEAPPPTPATSPTPRRSATVEGLVAAPSRFQDQAIALFEVIRTSQQRRPILLLVSSVASIILATAAAQVWLNSWQGSFYDAISRFDVSSFLHQLGTFAAIVGCLVVLGVGQTWCQEMLKIRLREGLTRDLIDRWLQPKRAYRLAMVGEIGVNPDQRMQEDARHLTELTATLAVGLFQATVLLASFIGVLWSLSNQVSFPINGHAVVVPGYMVWCAILYALAGSALAWIVGRPLVKSNEEHYAREAELRFSLVRISEAAEGIALYGGEPAERAKLEGTLASVLDVMRGLANNLARLTWITSTYGYVALVVPVIVASPGYFHGMLTFGQLMMVVGAFNQVQNSLRWSVDNLPTIADWRATFVRVMRLYDALVLLNDIDRGTQNIAISEGALLLSMTDLHVIVPDGEVALAERSAVIEPAERVQILGGPGSGKAMLFRALAGMWPSGSGSIALPSRDQIMFLPSGPYLPPGSLREVLAYPAPASTYKDADISRALERIGLGHLNGALDQRKRWDRELPIGEQHCVATARLLLHRPAWVVMDEVLGTLDDRGRELVFSIFEDELKHSALVSIDPAPLGHGFFARAFHLRRVSEEAPAPVKEPSRKRDAHAAVA